MYLNVKTPRQKSRTKGKLHKAQLKAKNNRRRRQIKA
jgi:hypothetical protein